jgi:hypothetical protein
MLRQVKVHASFAKGRVTFRGLWPVPGRLTVDRFDPFHCLIFSLLLPVVRRVTTTDFRKMVPRALGCWT